ncbi:MAG: hypothetical protein ACLQNE_39000 [Thermoguttaceae bacterium]|jgi:hypothetical protein
MFNTPIAQEKLNKLTSRKSRALTSVGGGDAQQETVWLDFLRKAAKAQSKDRMSSWLVFRQSVDGAGNSIRNSISGVRNDLGNLVFGCSSLGSTAPQIIKVIGGAKMANTDLR